MDAGATSDHSRGMDEPTTEPDPLTLLAYSVELADARSLLRLIPDIDGALEAELALGRMLAAIEGGSEPA